MLVDTTEPTPPVLRQWLSENKNLVVTVGCTAFLFVMYAWSLAPYPYSWNYWVKLMFVKPTYQCADGTYSWANSYPEGFCSTHGHAARRIH